MPAVRFAGRVSTNGRRARLKRRATSALPREGAEAHEDRRVRECRDGRHARARDERGERERRRRRRRPGSSGTRRAPRRRGRPRARPRTAPRARRRCRLPGGRPPRGGSRAGRPRRRRRAGACARSAARRPRRRARSRCRRPPTRGRSPPRPAGFASADTANAPGLERADPDARLLERRFPRGRRGLGDGDREDARAGDAGAHGMPRDAQLGSGLAEGAAELPRDHLVRLARIPLGVLDVHGEDPREAVGDDERRGLDLHADLDEQALQRAPDGRPRDGHVARSGRERVLGQRARDHAERRRGPEDGLLRRVLRAHVDEPVPSEHERVRRAGRAPERPRERVPFTQRTSPC